MSKKDKKSENPKAKKKKDESKLEKLAGGSGGELVCGWPCRECKKLGFNKCMISKTSELDWSPCPHTSSHGF